MNMADDNYVRKGAIIGGAVSAPVGVLTGLGHHFVDSFTNALAFSKPKASGIAKSIGAGSAVVGLGVAGGAITGRIVQRIMKKRAMKKELERSYASKHTRSPIGSIYSYIRGPAR